jgi:hypothetical protein
MEFPSMRRGWLAFGFALLLGTPGCGQIQDDELPPVTAAAPPPTAADVQVAANPDEYADTDPSALTDFHGTLDTHGAWIEDPNYGTVWVPNAAEVGPEFAPYQTAGHWAHDDTDYVWVSDYEWGWAPFHYGRWVIGYGGGWVWVPGRVYAPAWVSWRMGAPDYAYIGWYPMAPLFIWRGGYPMGYGAVAYGPERYYYVGHGDVFAPQLHGRVVAGPQVGAIAVHSTASVGHGPAPASIGVSGAAITRVAPGDRGTMMAKNFAKPSTALAMGAHAPAAHVVRGAPARRPSPGFHGARGGGGSVHRAHH